MAALFFYEVAFLKLATEPVHLLSFPFMKTTQLISRAITYLLIVGLISMAACKKKDVEPNDGVQGDWQMTSVKLDPPFVSNGVQIADLIAIYTFQGNDCPTKTTFSFKGDGAVNVTSPKECDDTREQLMDLVSIESGTTWKNENDMLLLTTKGSTLGAGLTVDETTMILNDEATLDDGKLHKITISFKRL